VHKKETMGRMVGLDILGRKEKFEHFGEFFQLWEE
jgi:hypothetical protein